MRCVKIRSSDIHVEKWIQVEWNTEILLITATMI